MSEQDPPHDWRSDVIPFGAGPGEDDGPFPTLPPELRDDGHEVGEASFGVEPEWPYALREGPDPAGGLGLAVRDKVTWGGQTVTVGRLGWKLLCALAASGNHVAGWADVCEWVYGESDAPRNKVDQLIHRVNAKLEKVDCPLRVGVQDRWWVALA
ncbi:---NA--- : [Gemmataceae bacterium]|nr:---NA--- : [Gemmataceae bacterium]VTT96516.1 ---NA--- : [Gemmataceae bacterium]